MLFGSWAAALLAELVLASSQLHVQDSIYARCDALVGLLVALTFWLTAQALRTQAARWRTLAAAVAGIAVATKYNALPLLLVPAWAAWVAPRRWRALLVVGAVAVVGFFVGTPEAVAHPSIFVEGMVSELRHYTSGHPPHQAFNGALANGNAYYWSTYLAWLGLGIIPLLGVLLFFWRALRHRTRDHLVVSSYVALATAGALASRVRFERNLEVVLPALAIAAGAGLIFFWRELLPPRWQRWPLAMVLLLVAALQPARTLHDFRGILLASAPTPPGCELRFAFLPPPCRFCRPSAMRSGICARGGRPPASLPGARCCHRSSPTW